MELFSVAHEYGHHAMYHEVGQADEGLEEKIEKEYRADHFAHKISQDLGLKDQPINEFALSGGGAVLVLTMNDLIERTKAVLNTGLGSSPPSFDHPTIVDRVNALAKLDGTLPPQHREFAEGLRLSLFAISDIIWAKILPGLLEAHFNKVRPHAYDSNIDEFVPVN